MISLPGLRMHELITYRTETCRTDVVGEEADGHAGLETRGQNTETGKGKS